MLGLVGSHQQEPVAFLTSWLPAFGGGGRIPRGTLGCALLPFWSLFGRFIIAPIFDSSFGCSREGLWKDVMPNWWLVGNRDQGPATRDGAVLIPNLGVGMKCPGEPGCLGCTCCFRGERGQSRPSRDLSGFQAACAQAQLGRARMVLRSDWAVFACRSAMECEPQRARDPLQTVAARYEPYHQCGTGRNSRHAAWNGSMAAAPVQPCKPLQMLRRIRGSETFRAWLSWLSASSRLRPSHGSTPSVFCVFPKPRRRAGDEPRAQRILRHGIAKGMPAATHESPALPEGPSAYSVLPTPIQPRLQTVPHHRYAAALEPAALLVCTLHPIPLRNPSPFTAFLNTQPRTQPYEPPLKPLPRWSRCMSDSSPRSQTLAMPHLVIRL